MKRKLLSLILAILVILTSACSSNENGQSKEVVKPALKDGAAEITIIMSAFDYRNFIGDSALMSYKSKFEKDLGVNVKLETAGPTSTRKYVLPEDQVEYAKDASTKLYTENGPELIFSDWFFINAAIEQGAVLDVKGKVQNISKIYDGLVRDKMYYVPVGVMYHGNGIKKQILKGLQQEEPGYEFTRVDYDKLIDQWVTKTNAYFTIDEYDRLFNSLVFPYTKRASKNDKVKINRPEIIDGIAKLRQEMFSDKYKPIEGFTYQSFYNALYEPNSKEWQEVQKLINTDDYFYIAYINNLLRVDEISEESKRQSAVMLPNFADEPQYIDTMGFMVNKNGKNIELAYEFLNGLLSNEVQMEMFNNGKYKFYPVNKNIEAEILKAEAQQNNDPKAAELKKYALTKLKEGQYKIEPDRDYKMLNLTINIRNDLDKLILTDSPKEGKALENELQKLEDRYNIWLNE